MSLLLQTNNLTIGYKIGLHQKKIAGVFNAALKNGELTCIMGPNGIGKSTFIRTIAGLQKPISGTVKVHGTDIHQISSQERARLLSVVLTTRPDFGFMTVRKLVELGRYPHTNWKHELNPNDQLIVKEAIEAVGLSDEDEKLVAELSDGNAQKAIIARALAQDTQFILLDEPTIHLDLANKLMILKLLSKLAVELGKSILIVSHDLSMVTQLADKLWLFKKDRLIVGTPEDLMLSGAVDETLGSKGFDLAQGTITRESTKLALTVKGDKELTHWMRKALIRKGYSVTKNAPNLIIASDHKLKLNVGDSTEVCESIEEAIGILERMQ